MSIRDSIKNIKNLTDLKLLNSSVYIISILICYPIHFSMDLLANYIFSYNSSFLKVFTILTIPYIIWYKMVLTGPCIITTGKLEGLSWHTDWCSVSVVAGHMNPALWNGRVRLHLLRSGGGRSVAWQQNSTLPEIQNTADSMFRKGIPLFLKFGYMIFCQLL